LNGLNFAFAGEAALRDLDEIRFIIPRHGGRWIPLQYIKFSPPSKIDCVVVGNEISVEEIEIIQTQRLQTIEKDIMMDLLMGIAEVYPFEIGGILGEIGIKKFRDAARISLANNKQPLNITDSLKILAGTTFAVTGEAHEHSWAVDLPIKFGCTKIPIQCVN